MERAVVGLLQVLAAWLITPFLMRLVPAPMFQVAFVVSAVLASALVWGIGWVGSQVMKGSSEASPAAMGATFVATMAIVLWFRFGDPIGGSLVREFLPAWAPAVWLALAPAAGYWAAQSEHKVGFEPVVPFAVLTGLLGAVPGSMLCLMAVMTLLGAGTFPRFLFAVPLLIGGALGLAAGAGLAHVLMYPFKSKAVAGAC